MPNWCSNSLTVKGKARWICEFILSTFQVCDYDNWEATTKRGDYILSFEKLLPTPVDDKGNLIKEWYGWRLGHWGTKWEPSVHDYELTFKLKDSDTVIAIRDDVMNEKYIRETMDSMDVNFETQIQISFDTAWSPPFPFIEYVAKINDGNDLIFELQYYEPGCGFAGEIHYQNNDIIYELSVGDDKKEYIRYLLDNNLEDEEYIKDSIYEKLMEKYYQFGKEKVDKVYEIFVKSVNAAKDSNFKTEMLANTLVSLDYDY